MEFEFEFEFEGRKFVAVVCAVIMIIVGARMITHAWGKAPTPKYEITYVAEEPQWGIAMEDPSEPDEPYYVMHDDEIVVWPSGAACIADLMRPEFIVAYREVYVRTRGAVGPPHCVPLPLPGQPL